MEERDRLTGTLSENGPITWSLTWKRGTGSQRHCQKVDQSHDLLLGREGQGHRDIVRAWTNHMISYMEERDRVTGTLSEHGPITWSLTLKRETGSQGHCQRMDQSHDLLHGREGQGDTDTVREWTNHMISYMKERDRVTRTLSENGILCWNIVSRLRAIHNRLYLTSN